MNTLFVFGIGVVYAFFGIIVVTATHYLAGDDDIDCIELFIFFLWPLVIIIALICFVGYCAYRIGKPIGEWLNKKLFKDQRG